MPSKKISSCSAVPLFPERDDPIKTAIQTSIRTGVSFTDTFKEQNLSGYQISVNTYFNYGKNTYVNGLPETNLILPTQDDTEINAALTTMVGEPATSVYFYFGLLEVGFFIHNYFANDLGETYNPSTYVLVDRGDADHIHSYTGDYSYQENVAEEEELYAEISIYDVINDTYTYYDELVPDSNADYAKYYIHIEAERSSDSKLFVYLLDDTDPNYSLFNLVQPETFQDILLPIVPLKYRNQAIVDYGTDPLSTPDISEDLYNDALRMFKILDLGIEGITDSLKESADYDKLEEVYLTFAANINTEEQVTKEYLFNFFESVHGDNPASYIKWKDAADRSKETYVSLSFSEATFNYLLSFAYITVTPKTGVIGNVGEYVTSIELQPAYTLPSDIQVNVDEYILQKQVSATSYEEIKVVGLFSQITQNNTLSTKYLHVVKDPDEDGIKDGGIFVPIAFSRLTPFAGLRRNVLLMDCSHLTYFAFVKQKLEWYETQLFRAILVITAFVLTVVSLGTAAPALYAATGSVLLTIIALVAIKIAISYVGKILVDLLVDILGEEATLLLVITLIIVSLLTQEDLVDVSAFTADVLLLTTNAVQAGFGAYLKEEFEEIQDKQELLDQFKEERMEEMEALIEKMDASTFEEAILLLDQQVYVEEPSDFYTRTIHSGNIGAKSLDVISNYAENTLRLPTINESTLRG